MCGLNSNVTHCLSPFAELLIWPFSSPSATSSMQERCHVKLLKLLRGKLSSVVPVAKSFAKSRRGRAKSRRNIFVSIGAGGRRTLGVRRLDRVEGDSTPEFYKEHREGTQSPAELQAMLRAGSDLTIVYVHSSLAAEIRPDPSSSANYRRRFAGTASRDSARPLDRSCSVPHQTKPPAPGRR